MGEAAVPHLVSTLAEVCCAPNYHIGKPRPDSSPAPYGAAKELVERLGGAAAPALAASLDGGTPEHRCTASAWMAQVSGA